MAYVSTALTTDRIKELAAKGQRMPSGSKVSSTVDSAQRALLKVRQEEEERRKFMERRLGSRAVIIARNQNQMISVSENTKVMPSYDAQSQTVDYSDTSKYNVQGSNPVTNNNVNPSALYTPQPVNSNGNSQNSSVSGGINANANYNYATQMNDFQTANPTGQVNMGESAQAWGYTGGKSSIPIDNEVKTSLLGGDIQHQESDINTNVSYLPEMNDPQDTIGSSINLGGAGIAIAGLGALLLMGKMK